jgi:hypothetical protein
MFTLLPPFPGVTLDIEGLSSVSPLSRAVMVWPSNQSVHSRPRGPLILI